MASIANALCLTVRCGKASYIDGVDQNEVLTHRCAVDESPFEQGRRELPRIVDADPDAVGSIIHEVAQRSVVAGGRQPALSDDEHLGSQPGHLLEDVARNE